jgi:glycosyltransferase involved in cell wall biosynthesis
VIRTAYHTYISRFSTFPRSIQQAPHPKTSLIICVPSINETNLLGTLESLAGCEEPKGMVEVIICINAPEDASLEVLSQNHTTYLQVTGWAENNAPGFLNLQVLLSENLPKKHAGAGWARKIAMDEALGRWAELDKDGPIVCLDADCTVSSNYLVKIEEAFQDKQVQLCHLEFHHLFERENNPLLQNGIVQYELHLRCHIAGLRWAGYPFAVHTVGSCMVVRASHYAKQGGMNRRKAGEDFYFMHKLLPLGGYMSIAAFVYPSCRVSERVPFGTGRSQWEWMKGNASERLTYSLSIYRELKRFFSALRQSYEEWGEINEPGLRGFFPDGQLEKMLTSFKKQSGDEEIYFRRVWQWMDGFRVLKLTHHLRDNGHSNVPVRQVAEELLRLDAFSPEESKRVTKMLDRILG